MTYILGISAFYHDSAACLLKDGAIIAASQEERFTRKKHDASFPKKAIDFCLKEAGISIDDVSLITFYEKPFVKFERIIDSIKNTVPFGFLFFKKAIQSWVKVKLWIPSIIRKELNYKGKMIFSEHHEAHAAGAFFTSPYKESAIVTVDGVGEKACITIGYGKDNHVKILKEQHYPHSFGLLYSAFTQYCGFKINSGEYKLMGLAPYGKPIYKKQILENLVSISKKGEVSLDMKYFSFDVGKTTINNHFCSVFGRPARKVEEKMSDFYCDIASSIQSVTEGFMTILLEYAKEITKSENVCLSGGVALNCKANGELLKRNIFKNIWVQPASGDSGGSMGSAFVGYYNYLKKERKQIEDSLKEQIYLGSSFSDFEIEKVLKNYNIVYNKKCDLDLLEVISEELKNKKIVGCFQGRAEFGPRALGNRSILGSPLYVDMKEHINMKIKMREGFRPFAPVVLEEKKENWFEMEDSSKYMLFTFKGKNKNKIPSCIHEDNTARVQSLQKKDNEFLHNLISIFEKKTSCPILINTSFNVRGEPIVNSPFDALNCFFRTHMDVLVLQNYVLFKENNKKPHKQFLKKIDFELD
ncbi:carbamoyltransferase family protein [Tenacibaculum ovolyticum]|uniref:carbamoyltransferase family protein n=1 Tax=Tenacibaculum ovolyticum TaxID=104270 RepID=UPI001F33B82F|nr:carbamoyltransferase N-terminal domain-containing protein [Tenacibaculum ovolyticum]